MLCQEVSDCRARKVREDIVDIGCAQGEKLRKLNEKCDAEGKQERAAEGLAGIPEQLFGGEYLNYPPLIVCGKNPRAGGEIAPEERTAAHLDRHFGNRQGCLQGGRDAA